MIHHATIEVADADIPTTVAFWELLGFELTEVPETLRERAVWLESGATQIHLLRDEDPTVPPSGHVAVVANDYEATLQRLREAGHEVDQRTQHWGSPRAY